MASSPGVGVAVMNDTNSQAPTTPSRSVGSRQDDGPADRLRGGLPTQEAALQTGQQCVARLAGIDEFIEAEVLRRR